MDWQNMTLAGYGIAAVIIIILISMFFEALVNWERTIGYLICAAATVWGVIAYLNHHYVQLFFAILLGIPGLILVVEYSNDK
jgi:hypothetical protein